VSIVVVFLLIVLMFVQKGGISLGLGQALVGGGLAVAVAGFLGDYYRGPVWVRLLIHFVAAGWALWCLNGVGPLHSGPIIWSWGWAGQIFAVVGLVWMINLYNFMDGIDSLAGVEAVSASLLGGLLLASRGLGGLSETTLALAGGSAGFLLWNWPPARLFMGDVGSGFLGFALGVIAIFSAKVQPVLFWPWLILLSAFIVDTTVTLIQRLITGECWYEAHRSHAYQHAAQRWGSHSKVTLAIAAINVFWLFPLAWGASAYPKAAPIFAVMAVGPLVYLAFRFDAGRGESSPVRKISRPTVGFPGWGDTESHLRK
jgi:Fuc2NAc and GlcNAc transferase